MISNIIIVGSPIILSLFLIMGICYLIILILSVPSIKLFFEYEEYTNIHRLTAFNFAHTKHKEAELPPVTVSIPVYNKNPLSIDSVKAVLNSNYKNLEIFIVNDASTDDVVEMYDREFKFKQLPLIIKNRLPTSQVKGVYISTVHSNLYLIDKESGGVGDNHNVSINMSTSPFFITCDSDSVMEPNAITNLVLSMLSDSDFVAVGGAVFISNGCKFKDGLLEETRMPDTYIGKMQVNEYVRGHLFSRTGWNALGGALSYSGTATIFDKKALISVGGFDTDNYSQDAEVVMKLQQYADDNKLTYKTLFSPSTAVWTFVPATLKSYIIQRNHWHRGLMKSFLPYFFKVFKTGNFKNILRYILFILLEILSPLIEITAYVFCIVGLYLGIVSIYATLLFIKVSWLFLISITLTNYFLNNLTFKTYSKVDSVWQRILYTTLEMIGFRQISVITYTVATFHFIINRLRGKPL